MRQYFTLIEREVKMEKLKYPLLDRKRNNNRFSNDNCNKNNYNQSSSF